MKQVMSLSSFDDENRFFKPLNPGVTGRALLLVSLYAADAREKSLLQILGLSSIITSKFEIVTKLFDLTICRYILFYSWVNTIIVAC